MPVSTSHEYNSRILEGIAKRYQRKATRHTLLLPGNPNNQKEIDVSTVPAISYVKDFNDFKLAPYWNNQMCLIVWGPGA